MVVFSSRIRSFVEASFGRMILLSLLVFMATPSVSMGAELNIYSYRQPHLLEPFLSAYTSETGVKFNVVHAPKGLVERLQSEGSGSPADVVLTVDISRLHELSKANLLAPLSSSVINSRIPSHLRDSSGDKWTALSTRARIIAVSKDRVADGAIKTIEDLAKPEWRGRICTRKGSHVYNRALLASLVVHHGEAQAESWAKGLVANLARKPQGNDRAQAKAIFAGECDVALMNTYYYGLMRFNDKNPEQKQWASAINIVFFNQSGRGQHVNISGGAIVKTSPRKDEARAFLEWMTSLKAQEIYARVNYEYPANSDVSADVEVSSWGQFKADDLSIVSIAEASVVAQKIIDRTGW